MRKLLVQSRLSKVVSTAALALVLTGPLTPVMAQDAQTEARIRKLEAEIRALQRKVFPGGDNRFFEAEIKQSPTAGTPGAAPATSAVTDMLARMDALETQVTRLTGQIEENSNRIAQLEGRAGVGASPAVSPPDLPPGFSPSPSPAPSTPALPPNPAPPANFDATTGGTPAASSAASTSPSPNRMEAVRAIAKPQTNDAGDDEYSYGFRLWDAKFYPEAQQQLKMFVEKYPKHQRTSWGRNLLGRAYLDDGNPREAAKWFLQNYQSDKSGGRAPDSLLYLAVAMKQLKDTKRACISLAEFSEAYAAEAAGRLRSLYESTRNGLDCDQ